MTHQQQSRGGELEGEALSRTGPVGSESPDSGPIARDAWSPFSCFLAVFWTIAAGELRVDRAALYHSLHSVDCKI